MFAVANLSDVNEEAEQEGLKNLEEAASDRDIPVVAMNASLEHELLDFPEEEWDDYFSASGLDGPAKSKVIQTSYRVLSQHSFLTYGEDEVRAWTIPVGMEAQKAAGKIHSDIERGFIRAEVIAFEEFLEYGSEDAVKKAGKFRLEGKDYVVRDGDMITFRFSV